MSDRDKKEKKHKKEKKDKKYKKKKANGFSRIASKLDYSREHFASITFVAQTLLDQQVEGNVRFNLGMSNYDSHPDIICNEEGDLFSCKYGGMYHLEFCGSILLKETNKTIISFFQEGQKEEITTLSTTIRHGQEGFPIHASSSTIIPISKDIPFSLRMKVESGSVFVLENFRLIIFRVS